MKLLGNGWFWFDCIAYSISYVEVGICLSGRSARLSPAFRVFASVGIVFFWLRVLGAVKVFQLMFYASFYSLNEY